MKTLLCWLLMTTVAVGGTITPKYYVMVGVNQNNVKDNVLQSPSVAGWLARTTWDTPTDLQYLMDEVKKAATLNKHVNLSIQYGKKHWPKDHSIQAYDISVANFGFIFDNDPRVDKVHISFRDSVGDSPEWFSAPGFSDTQLITDCEHDIDQFAKAFPDKPLVADLAMMGSYNSPVTATLIAYCEKIGHVEFSEDSLKADTDPSYKPYAFVAAEIAKGFVGAYEMVDASANKSRFGGTFQQALALGNKVGASWYQIYQTDVVNIPKPVVRTYGSVPEPSTIVLVALFIILECLCMCIRVTMTGLPEEYHSSDDDCDVLDDEYDYHNHW